MKLVYIIILCILYCVMYLCSRSIDRRGLVFGKSLLKTVNITAIVILCYSLSICIPNSRSAIFFRGCYCSSTCFLLIALYEFIRDYAGHYEKNHIFNFILYVIVVLDGSSMLLNVVFGHIFRYGTVVFANGERCGIFYYDTLPYYGHLLLLFGITMLSAFTLLRAIKNSPSIYKPKYYSVLIVLATEFTLDMVYVFTRQPLDIGLFSYVFFPIVIYFLTCHYLPYRLARNIQHQVLEDMKEAIIGYDNDEQCIYCNRHAYTIFGSKASVKEISEEFRRLVGDEFFYDTDETRKFDLELKEAGAVKHFEIKRYGFYDTNRKDIGYFFIIIDRTVEYEKFRTERFNARHDHLTKVYNKECFYEEVGKLFEANPKEDYYMIRCNVKDFKLFNELFGEERGNELVIDIARRIDAITKPGAVYGRISGDHFVLCLPRDRFMISLFQDAINAIAEKFGTPGYRLFIQIGIYTITDKSISVSVMCDRAKMAMEKLENKYNNNIAFFDKDILDEQIKQRELISSFDAALEEEQFKIYLQPQTDLEGNVLGAEALVRWENPERGLMYPTEFIPLYEKVGLIHRLDRYTWDKVAAIIRRWLDEGREDFYISVNISPMDFYFLNVYDVITETVIKYDIPSSYLKLEITETAIAQNKDEIVSFVSKLKRQGFSVQIDDFGSGYSSLSVLMDIPYDVLKLDMSFLQGDSNEEGRKILVTELIKMASRLGLGVISEGVENREQAAFLYEAGCRVFQGYYFGRPASVEAYEDTYLKK